MRILGIDPGLIATGYGVVEMSEQYRLDCLAAGVIRPDSKDLTARLLQIHEQVTKILHEFIPDALAIEDLFTTYEHPKTAVLMGHARGVVVLAAAQRAVPVINYAPTEMKRAVTGHGRASKQQVQAMVQRLLRLPEAPTPDHVSDALALAVCHAYRERGNILLPR
ncbi:MAG: crossover junction endodeoxyribonuclease RuvC [Armatimonadota bacterium]